MWAQMQGNVPKNFRLYDVTTNQRLMKNPDSGSNSINSGKNKSKMKANYSTGTGIGIGIGSARRPVSRSRAMYERELAARPIRTSRKGLVGKRLTHEGLYERNSKFNAKFLEARRNERKNIDGFPGYATTKSMSYNWPRYH
eukprot:CAMPEP_0197540016 /NCGR_PEP_ID=MMETSP1318-20131121/64470_1 /TAXON_ID=552666 /ORGANISM="Partenskyella glossopodia, Strain RCC365" /LENGTH=140 /DNA_ID=CAMNT_0043098889 /DNA_START=92 /DNA_END=514 /DNA_ORIENTATION=-